MKTAHILKDTFRWALSGLCNLNLTRNEECLLRSVISRTLSWNKVSERVTDDTLLSGNIRMQIDPLPYGLSVLYRARKGLVDKRFIFVESSSGYRRYTVNMPFLLYTRIVSLLEKQAGDPDLHDRIKELVSWVPTMEKIMPEDLYSRTSLSDVIARAKKIDKTSKEKIVDKPLTVDRLPLFIDHCIDGVTAEGEDLTHTNKVWTGKVRGKAKHWLKECKQEGRDPKADLAVIISQWYLIANRVKNHFGKKMSLPPSAFSFELFYDNRKAIMLWLAENYVPEGESADADFVVQEMSMVPVRSGE